MNIYCHQSSYCSCSFYQEVVGKRKEGELFSSINTVQEGEKKKLLLVAAQHLDALQDKVQELSDMTGGKSEKQQKYLQDQILETETAISEALECILSIKADLILA